MKRFNIFLALFACFAILSGGVALAAFPHVCMMSVEKTSAMPDCHKKVKSDSNKICKKCTDCVGVSYVYASPSFNQKLDFSKEKFAVSMQKNESRFFYILLAPPKFS